MRAALLIIAALALAGFLAVAVVLPQMAGSEARDAAQALISGPDAAKRVGRRREKAGNLSGRARTSRSRRAATPSTAS